MIANRPASRWSELGESLPLQFNDYTVFCFSVLEIVGSVSCSPNKNPALPPEGNGEKGKGEKYLEIGRIGGRKSQSTGITPITKSFSPSPFVHCLPEVSELEVDLGSS